MNKQMHISVMFRVEQAAVNTQWTPDTTQEQDVVLDMSFDRKDRSHTLPCDTRNNFNVQSLQNDI